MQMLGSRQGMGGAAAASEPPAERGGEGGASRGSARPAAKGAPTGGKFDDFEDDIPF